MPCAQARQIDQFNITSMDEYALLLRSKAEHSELNRLVQDLLKIDSGRPEVWVASAVYWDMRDDKERAATYADKVCAKQTHTHMCTHIDTTQHTHASVCVHTCMHANLPPPRVPPVRQMPAFSFEPWLLRATGLLEDSNNGVFFVLNFVV